MKIKKAVIPVAGKGTRMLPFTKAASKELMPILTKPAIHYVVQEALDAGIEQIVFITSIGKEDIQKYFTRNIELETFLQTQGNLKDLEEIKNIGNMVDVITINQKEQLGLGHAILQAEKVIGSEPFAVLLGDDLIEGKISVISQLQNISEKQGGASVIAVMEVPPDQTHKYGIIAGDFVDASKKTLKINKMVEKPKGTEAPSQLATPGRYIFNSEIFNYLKLIQKGVNNEYQLTDAINMMAQKSSVYAHIFEGERFDTGHVLGYFDAVVNFALKDPKYGPEFRAIINKRLK